MNSALHLVGIAKKAGRLEVGEEPVGAAARARQARLILVAADAADNSVRRAAHFAQQGNVPWLQVPFTKGELGMTLGRSSCAMLALTDIGLAASLAERLAAEEPERCGETAQALREKAGKALQRQKEQRAHEKKLRAGRKVPWAAPPPVPKGPAKPKKAPAKAAGPAATGAPKKRPVPRGIVSIKRKETP